MSRRFIFSLLIGFWLANMAIVGQPAGAQDGINPAPLCAKRGQQIFCYSGRANAVFSTPANQPAIDFALSPDGGSLLYRLASGQLYMVALGRNTDPQQLDSEAMPPVPLSDDSASLVWSPDGLGVAYLVANGLRVLYPNAGGVSTPSQSSDRLYRNLAFSGGGRRLAAQDIDGGWSIFSTQTEAGLPVGLSLSARYDQAADLAWFDDNNVLLAFRRGGLMRLTLNEAGQALTPVWAKPDGRYDKLIGMVDSTVRAFAYDSEAFGGQPVEISLEGAINALGGVRIDPRARWLSSGRALYYIAGGTPILIYPETGNEDSLFVDQTDQVAWGTPAMLTAGTLALDADIYYLAPDQDRVRQVWRLPADGINSIQQLTYLPESALDFAISPDRRQAVITMGRALVLIPLPGATPPANATGVPAQPEVAGVTGSRVLAFLRGPEDTGARPNWRADGGQIIFADAGNLYLLDVPFNALFSTAFIAAPTLIARGDSANGYSAPSFSPDRRYLLAQQADSLVVLPLSVGAASLGSYPAATTAATWGLNALFVAGPTGDGQYQLQAADSAGSAVLAQSAYPLGAVLPLGGGGLGAAAQAALYFRNVGWPNGPAVLQLMSTSGDPAQSGQRGGLLLLQRASISPTGRFALGLERANWGNMLRLIVVDLENGRKFAIRDTNAASQAIWVR
jgi:hypothetical protein